MSAVDKVSRAVSTAGALAVVVGLRATFQDDGRVEAVKIFGVIPLFRRRNGEARILGFRAKRLD